MKLVTIKRNRNPGSTRFDIVTGARISRTADDPGEAAAVALDAALGTNGAYCIVGCDEVVKRIPAALRSRGVEF